MTSQQRFIPGHKTPPTKTDQAHCLLFYGDRLLVDTRGASPGLPTCGDLTIVFGDLSGFCGSELYLGRLDGVDCYTLEHKDESQLSAGLPAVEGYTWKSLRALFNSLPPELVSLSGRAIQTLNWFRNHQFCGRCGKPTTSRPEERSMVCATCELTYYPRISPAMIVAVVRDGKILLARARRFKKEMYSVLAGFAEPGESLEDCVRREVREEVGIEITNLCYFASQPWPFPDSLMVAFTAEHAAGEIEIDGSEIEAAAWFAPDELPLIPGKVSVARSLIDWFVAENGE